MLRVENLNAGYEKLQILFDISLKAESKKITSIIGPNGSGKSTLLKAIFGLINIYSGKIYLKDKDITYLRPHEKVKIGIVYIPQTDNVFTNLTVKENLKIAGFTLDKLKLEKKINEVLEFFPNLKGMLNRRAMFLSGGERQMLAIAMGLIKEPKVIMLDEPSANLSPKVSEEIFEKIYDLKYYDEISIILVEQNVRKALEISDYTYVLIGGKKVLEGKPEKIINDQNIRKFYLGF